jgi:diguanylate cyclase (GGDEF)-like protein
MTLIVIVAQLAVYWQTGFNGWPVYAVLMISWLLILAIGIGHLASLVSTQKAAMFGLIVVSFLIAITPILHPTDLLHPTWYLVIVLFSYIFFSRQLSLIIMFLIYVYFLLYALVLIPGTYNLDEIVTLTASIFVTGALCSAVSRESGQLYKHLAVAANTDPMTGLWNRRGVEKIFKELVTLNREERIPYSIAVLDLDNFKLVNDKLGHKIGDQVICLAANLIREVVRECDIVARLGGEEFLLILPKDSACSIKAISDRIRVKFESKVLTAVGDDFSTIATISIGAVYDVPPNLTFPTAMQLADKMMYAAKHQGRNTVVAVNYNECMEKEQDVKLTPMSFKQVDANAPS